MSAFLRSDLLQQEVGCLALSEWRNSKSSGVQFFCTCLSWCRNWKSPYCKRRSSSCKWQPADACNPIKYVSILKWGKSHTYLVSTTLCWWTSAANRFLARQMHNSVCNAKMKSAQSLFGCMFHDNMKHRSTSAEWSSETSYFPFDSNRESFSICHGKGNHVAEWPEWASNSISLQFCAICKTGK